MSLSRRRLEVRWGYEGKPEYTINLLDDKVLKWMGIDPSNVDYDRIEISNFFPPSSYLKTDRNVMPSDQRIWGSGSAIIPDNNGRNGVACVVVRHDCSDPGNTHLNVDLWGWNAQREAICDSDNQLVPKERGHFLDDSRPVVVIVSLDDTHLESKIPPIKKTPTSFNSLSTLSDRIRRERAILCWVIATILGAVLNLIFLDRFWAFLVSYAWPPSMDGWMLMVVFIIIATAAFLYPITYSVMTSHLLPEKRYVSPLYLELVTIALLIVGQFYVFQANPSEYPSANAYSTVLNSAFLFLNGMICALVGQPLVGVVGQERHKCTLKIEAPSHLVDRLVGQRGLRSSLGFEHKERLEDGKLILYRNDEPTFQFMAFLTAGQSENQSLMHFEAYRLTTYAIETDEESASEFDMRVGYFKRVLSDQKISVKDDDGSAFPFMPTAARIALSPTRSKLATVKKVQIPPKTAVVIVGVAFLAITAYVFMATGQFTTQELLTTLLGIGFAVIGITPWIKGPRIKREEEWDEWN